MTCVLVGRDFFRLGEQIDGIFRCGNFGMLVLALMDNAQVDISGISSQILSSSEFFLLYFCLSLKLSSSSAQHQMKAQVHVTFIPSGVCIYLPVQFVSHLTQDQMRVRVHLSQYLHSIQSRFCLEFCSRAYAWRNVLRMKLNDAVYLLQGCACLRLTQDHIFTIVRCERDFWKLFLSFDTGHAEFPKAMASTTSASDGHFVGRVVHLMQSRAL